MAIYLLNIQSISRGESRTAVGAAAYRSGERLHDDRAGRWHDHSERTDIRHKEILLPDYLQADRAVWAADRNTLWNTAERAEHNRNGRVAREYLVALPHELPEQGRIQLARHLAREIADRHRVAVDLAVHDPRPQGDSRNFHAHLMATTREALESGLGAKAGLDMSAFNRERLYLPPGIREMRLLRERWADLANEAMHSAGLAERIDHRTLAAQGIDREPQPRIPYAAVQMERRGERTEAGDRLRAFHARQEELRADRGASASAGSDGLELVRAHARKAWLQMREQKEQAAQASAIRGNDHGL